VTGILKLLVICISIVAALYIVGTFPPAALVVMALGLSFIFAMFKDT
tara:strand:+ start:3682 stop:3822 length:141 start_codon:yes stop_codon:yes gene_type:complete